MNISQSLTDEEIFLGRVYWFIRQRAAYVRQREATVKTPDFKPASVNIVDKDRGKLRKKNSLSRDRFPR